MEYNKPLYEDVKRGEIYFVNVDEDNIVGSEQCHDRPAIIVSNDIGNSHSGIVEIVYLTTAPKKQLPTHVEIYTTQKPSTALCEQICTVSKFRLRKYINQCSEREMDDIDNALMISLGLSKAKGIDKYMEKWSELLIEQESQIETSNEQTEDIQYITQADVELELYKKFYEDMRELLKLSVGGK